MLRKLILTHFVLVLTIGLFTQCNAQKRKTENQTNVANTDVVVNRPSDEAKIEGNIPDYVIKEKNLDYLQTLPLPEIQFVFESQNNMKMDLSDNVKNILMLYWKDAIKLRYERDVAKPKEVQGYSNKTSAIFNLSEKTWQSIQKIEVDAPNGKRKISENEASEIIRFVNLATVKIMEKVNDTE